MKQDQLHIPYLSLQAVTEQHLAEIQGAVQRVVAGGRYLQGKEGARFEHRYAYYIGSRHCVGCANGLDALTLIFMAYKAMGVLHDGDEVIVPANTYIASILAITETGLKAVLVEPHADTLQLDETCLEAAITSRTRAVMLVHLYGRNAWTPVAAEICVRHDLLLIEDNAQAHGCTASLAPVIGEPATLARFADPTETAPTEPAATHRRRTGSLGHAAAHSFYPGKNLGALGDAGAVTTDDEALATMVRTLGNYGSSRKYVFPYRGRNSRLDDIQAAVLSVKLQYLDADNARRKAIAGYYYDRIGNPLLTLPGKVQWEQAQPADADGKYRDEDCVYHIFPVLCAQRSALQQFLADADVGTMIHYPIPPHRQACYKAWNDRSYPITEHIHHCELSIPCNPTMTDAEVETVANLLNRFSIKA